MEQPHYLGTIWNFLLDIIRKVGEDHPGVDMDEWLKVCGVESVEITMLLVDFAGPKNFRPNFGALLRNVFETSIPKTTIASLSQRKEG